MKKQQLQEGVDYIINDEGFVEFTKEYLLRREECCHNDCKNCPYPDCWCKKSVRKK